MTEWKEKRQSNETLFCLTWIIIYPEIDTDPIPITRYYRYQMYSMRMNIEDAS